jgi:23S rRNA pseudouridine1911/1915/1917 synthase
VAKQQPEVLFENDYLIAINKPAGMLSIPDREGKELSLKQYLLEKYQQIFVIHRLDRDTSGVILFAKDEATHKELSKLFLDRTVEKYYTGLVLGDVLNEQGSIEVYLGEHPTKKGVMTVMRKGKHSHTDYTVKERFGKYTFMEFQIHTGRTHQIRVHMKYLGHPLVCDEVYGDGNPLFVSAFKRNYKLSKHEENERPILSRLALHAERIVFTFQSQQIEIIAEAPKDIRACLQQMRK